MNSKNAYAVGAKLGLKKAAAKLQAKNPALTKIAKALTTLERRGRLSGAAADVLFAKVAGATPTVPPKEMDYERMYQQEAIRRSQQKRPAVTHAGAINWKKMYENEAAYNQSQGVGANPQGVVPPAQAIYKPPPPSPQTGEVSAQQANVKTAPALANAVKTPGTGTTAVSQPGASGTGGVAAKPTPPIVTPGEVSAPLPTEVGPSNPRLSAQSVQQFHGLSPKEMSIRNDADTMVQKRMARHRWDMANTRRAYG